MHALAFDLPPPGAAAPQESFFRAPAFGRTLGWVSEGELALAGKRVAIAGLDGVGGSHLLTLARLGVGRFSLAELDTQFDAYVGRVARTWLSWGNANPLQRIRLALACLLRPTHGGS